MEQISGLTIVCLIIALTFCLLLPMCVLFGFKKKTNTSWMPFFAGAAAYLFFVMMLEQMIHMLFLGTDNPISRAVLQYPIVYAVYLSFFAALFEEGARYAMFRIVLKKEKGRESAVTFGIGFTMVETLAVAMTMFSMIMVAFQIKNGGIDAYLSAVQPKDLAQTEEAVKNFIQENPISFLNPCLERIAGLLVNMGLSAVVFASVREKKPVLLAWAFVLHILETAFSSLYQAEILNQTAVVEILTLLMASGVAWIGWKVYQKLPKSERKKEIVRSMKPYRKMY